MFELPIVVRLDGGRDGVEGDYGRDPAEHDRGGEDVPERRHDERSWCLGLLLARAGGATAFAVGAEVANGHRAPTFRTASMASAMA